MWLNSTYVKVAEYGRIWGFNDRILYPVNYQGRTVPLFYCFEVIRLNCFYCLYIFYSKHVKTFTLYWSVHNTNVIFFVENFVFISPKYKWHAWWREKFSCENFQYRLGEYIFFLFFPDGIFSSEHQKPSLVETLVQLSSPSCFFGLSFNFNCRKPKTLYV